MSSLFELEDRVRRFREALDYVKRATFSNADELRAAIEADSGLRAGEEWRLFLAELREFASEAEALASSPKRPARRLRRASVEMAAKRTTAAAFGATVH